MVKSEDGGYTLISTQEMLEREKKYMHCLQDISVSCNFIKDSTQEFARLEEERATREHWEHHIRCDGLPRPYLPPEMRTFLAKKRHFQQFDADYNVDWTLCVDERSVLSQDIFRKDRTKAVVREMLDDRIGYRYEDDVLMYLNTLTKIGIMLDNPAEMDRVGLPRLMEIMEVRREIEEEIDNSFDRLTYRIIRMDGVYMNSDDAMIATWSHASSRYAIDIWGLRNVPIRFKEMHAPFMVAEMHTTEVTVQIPLSVLKDCLTLRCIHTNFDNYSQYAKSYDAIVPEGNVDVNAGIVDIEECLVNEWMMQLDVQKELLDNMLAKRQAYEEIMEIIAERTEKANKEQKNNDGSKPTKIVIPKAPREPPIVPPDMLPDAYNSFLVREQQQYMDFLDEIYNPQNLKLRMDEINMRQHIILGGIYSIMFVRRPMNTNFEKFNVVLHEDGRVLHIMDDVVADLRPNWDADSRAGSSQFMTNRSVSRLRVDKKRGTFIEDDELPYFFVTIKMPPELCMWGEPIPCQYITCMQDVLSETSVEEKKESVYIKKRKSKLNAHRHTEMQRKDSVQFNQIVRNNEPHSINVFRPTLLALLRCSRKLAPGERVLPVRNFQLVQVLNHLQGRQLQRYCVPRIISSFKFPLEVKEELEQAFDQRPKTKNMLIRRRSADVEENFFVGELDFDYDIQHAPERLYPVFSDIERVKYDERSINEKLFDKKSMYGLLDTFDNISNRYITRYHAIMNQSDFIVKKAKKAVVPAAAATEYRTSSMIGKLKSLSRFTTSRHSSTRVSHSPLGGISPSGSAVRSSSLLMGAAPQVGQGAETPDEVVFEEPEQKPQEKVTHWTTQYIMSSTFDRKARTMTIKTDRLGIFGFAYKRYEHFPFSDWYMQPNEENPEEVLLSVDTFHCRVILYISAQGVRGYVTNITSAYVANPIKYLEIPTPITDLRELRQRFYDKSINIFAENDAYFYIDNGYFSVKHMATEDHTYDAMALHCKLMKFYRSSWNRLASRRNILMGMKTVKDNMEMTMRITPENVTFVEVAELCSDDLDQIKLDFKNTWRNMSHYTDLHQAIISMNPHATDGRNRDPLFIFHIKRMLNELHLMSFS